jgi:hypothetical protein
MAIALMKVDYGLRGLTRSYERADCPAESDVSYTREADVFQEKMAAKQRGMCKSRT